MDGSDRQFIRMILEIFNLRAMLQRMRDRQAAAMKLGGLEYIALSRLSAEAELGVQELADRLALSGAFTTSIVNSLVEKGLVVKASHPIDRRRVRLSITEQGLQLLARFAPLRQQVNDVAFEPLTAKEFQQFAAILHRLVASNERAMALHDYLLKSRNPRSEAPPAPQRPRKA